MIVFYNKINDTCNKFVSLILYAQENPIDVYKPVDTIKSPLYTDYIHQNAKLKGLKWKYYLKLIRGCSGNDTIISDTMAIDLTFPNRIEIDSVTVNNGKTEIGWKAAVSTDTKGYIIYYKDNNGIISIIDTVFGKNNTFYRDNQTGNPDKRSEKYLIAAIDSCDNIYVLSNEHNTLIDTAVQDTCKEEITISWNKYLRWPDNQCDYSILASKNGGPYLLAHKMTTNSTSYTLSGFENYAQYCFKVRVINTDSNFSSSSNVRCITTNFIEKPSYLYLSNVTVNGNDLDVKWSIDKVSQIKEFRVYKNEQGGPYALYQTIPYDNNTDYLITDNSVEINKTKYRYYIEETDVCNNPPLKSNEGGNILLENQKLQQDCFLKWNRYSEWYGGLASQTLYIQKQAGASILDNFNNSYEKYKKTLSLDEQKESSICFYITNQEGDSNRFGFKEESTSNISCIQGSPLVFVPSAFKPKGINTTFKPIGTNIDSTQTQVKIFNRWGQMIWYGSGIGAAWDGRDANNKDVPAGVYYYSIIIIGIDRSKTSFTGNVTLIR